MKLKYYQGILKMIIDFFINITLYIFNVKILSKEDKNKVTINIIKNQHNDKSAFINYYFWVDKDRYITDIKRALEGKNLIEGLQQMSIFYVLDKKEAKKFIKKYNSKTGVLCGELIPKKFLTTARNCHSIFKLYDGFGITGYLYNYNGVTFLELDLFFEDDFLSMTNRVMKNKDFIKEGKIIKYPFFSLHEKSFSYYYNETVKAECMKIEKEISNKMKITGFCLLNIYYITRKNELKSFNKNSKLKTVDNDSLSGKVDFYFENDFVTYAKGSQIDTFKKLPDLDKMITNNYINILANVCNSGKKIQENLLTILNAKQHLIDAYNFNNDSRIDEIINVAKFINDSKNTQVNKRIGWSSVIIAAAALFFAAIQFANYFRGI